MPFDGTGEGLSVRDLSARAIAVIVGRVSSSSFEVFGNL